MEGLSRGRSLSCSKKPNSTLFIPPKETHFILLLVALTGGIACGKTVIAEILKNLGCYVEESDKVAHLLMEPEQPAWNELVSHFGKNILNPDRTVNRSKLGAIIFKNKKERLVLNQILHPRVMDQKRATIEKLRKKGEYKIPFYPMCIFSSSLDPSTPRPLDPSRKIS